MLCYYMEKWMYHTQENRPKKLNFPIICNRADAWFGQAYYFWEDRVDAVNWGIKSKGNNYEIYTARIKTERVLDTAFNREHYEFLLKCLEKFAKHCIMKTGRKPTKSQIYDYFTERAKWKDEVDVLLACDYPCGGNELFPGFQYRKRIQAAVYNETVIFDFQLEKT